MKNVPKLYIPKTVKVVNPKAKMTPREAKFAKWQVGAVKTFVTLRKK